MYCTVGQFKSCRRGMGDSVFVFPLLELFFDDHIINATSLRIPGDNSEATTSWKVVPLRLEKRVLYPTVAPSLAFLADPGANLEGDILWSSSVCEHLALIKINISMNRSDF